MLQDTYIQSILNFFCSMDIDTLRFFLKDEYTYEDTSKEIFLNEIEGVFNAFRHAGDTELLLYKGRCAGERCENCGKKGYRFVGNKSKNYLDFIFETEGDDIKDIYSCSIFKSDIEIDGLGSKEYIDINDDDLVTFEKTPEYWSKVNSALLACSEIISGPTKRISFEEMNYWVNKHTVTDEFIGHFDEYSPTMKWTNFSRLYNQLQTLRDYITRNLNDIELANQKINQINNEQDLIDWILNFEFVYNDAPSDFKGFVEKENEHFIWNWDEPVIFEKEIFTQVFSFLTFFSENNDRLLEKYAIYSFNEIIEMINYHNPVSWEIDFFSLKFHLENRKGLEEIGITIPFYIDKITE